MDNGKETPWIGDHSALRCVPTNLGHRQTVFLDGIRYCLEICDVSYRELRTLLWTISSAEDEQLSSDVSAQVVAKTWLLVDALNRLRSLCKQLPEISGMPFCRQFVQTLLPVVKPRNAAQHLHDRIDKLVSSKMPVWGCISWMTCVEDPPVSAEIHMFVPGSFRKGERTFLKPGGQNFRLPLDLITLTADGGEVPLGTLIRATEEFSRALDAALWESFDRNAPHGHDLYMRGEISFNDGGIGADLTVAFK